MVNKTKYITIGIIPLLLVLAVATYLFALPSNRDTIPTRERYSLGQSPITECSTSQPGYPTLPKEDTLLVASTSPTIGPLKVDHAIINAGIQKEVIAAIFIPDPNLIPSSVNLQRLDASGNVIAILGNLRDDGLNGDKVAGDKVFTLKLALNEPGPGEVRLRASAGFKGLLQRLFSDEAIIVVIQPKGESNPEAALQQLAALLITTTDINEVLPFYTEKAGEILRQEVEEEGTGTLREWGELFQNAKLTWKSENYARFKITFILPGGKEAVGEITLIKDSEGKWRIDKF